MASTQTQQQSTLITSNDDQPTQLVNDLLEKADAEEEQKSVKNCSFQSAPPNLWHSEHRGTSPPPIPLPRGATVSPTPTAPPLADDAEVDVYPIDKSKFEYPRIKAEAPENAAMLQKLFLGNIRYEMTREALQWVFLTACKVEIPIRNILVHVKTNPGGAQQLLPTGCASVYVDYATGEKLLAYNLRIFCNAANLYVTASKEKMGKLINDRRVLDLDQRGRKLRGPKNAMVIEASRGPNSNSPQGSFTSATMGFNHPNLFQSFGSQPMSNDSFGSSGQASPFGSFAFGPDSAMAWMNEVKSINYPFNRESQQQQQENSAMTAIPPLNDPVELFIGGIRYEATEAFVAWLLRTALAEVGVAAPIHSSQITLFTESSATQNKPARKKQNNAGCAIARVERQYVDRLLALTKCVLCVPHGMHYARNASRMEAFIRERQSLLRGGPSHAVVIELRKNGSSHGSAAMLRQCTSLTTENSSFVHAPAFQNDSLANNSLVQNYSFCGPAANTAGNQLFNPLFSTVNNMWGPPPEEADEAPMPSFLQNKARVDIHAGKDDA